MSEPSDRPSIRLIPLLGVVMGIAALIASEYARPSTRMVYNASDSAPRGWYRLMPAKPLSVGNYVVVRLPRGTAQFAATRGYLPPSVPVLKRIAAIGGQHVCVRDSLVYVDRAPLARTLDVDRMGRAMEPWAHCRRLMADELFLLNVGNPASFDSRYFGPIDASFVVGRATALWTW